MSHLSSEAIVFCRHFCLRPIVVVAHSDKVILLQMLGCCRFGKFDFNTGRRLSKGLSPSGFRTSKASCQASKYLV